MEIVINDFNGEEIIGTFNEKKLQKKGSKLYVKWKSYDNSFNSWIGTKDLI